MSTISHKKHLLPFLFICCSLSCFAQIKPDLYINNEIYCTYWLVNVKTDTAYLERLQTKKQFVYYAPKYSLDTLIKQDENKYTGRTYYITQKDGSLYLAKKSRRRKKMTSLQASYNNAVIYNILHNTMTMESKETYSRYSLTKQYLDRTGQSSDEITSDYNDLKQNLNLDEKEFLSELAKFERKHLSLKIVVEDY